MQRLTLSAALPNTSMASPKPPLPALPCSVLRSATGRPFRLIFPVRHSPEQCRRGDGGCEYFFSKKDAERREMYLKTTAGRKGLKLILRETLQSHVWD